jgi:carbon monoxide dehydrogenase subunit G
MEITDTHNFAAAPEEVWAVLMDPDAIKACLRGCRELRPVGDNRYHADVTIGVGAVSGVFTALVELSEQSPPDSYRISVHATGKPGFAHGFANVLLRRVESGTEVEVNASAEVGGLIARVGQRLIEGVARFTLAGFFSCLGARLRPAGPGT